MNFTAIIWSAGNLGYTDVERVQNAEGDWEYVRTFDDTEVPTAFGSLPDVEWGKVLGDLLNLLRVGIEQAIDNGIEGEPGPNALAELLKLLGLGNSSSPVGSGLGLTSVTGPTEGLVGNALGSTLQSEESPSDALEPVAFTPSDVSSTETGSGQTVQLSQTTTADSPPPRRRPVREIIESLGNSVTTPQTTDAPEGSTSRPTPLKGAAKRASDDVKRTADSVNDGLKTAVKDVQKAVKDTAKKVSDAARPKAGTSES